MDSIIKINNLNNNNNNNNSFKVNIKDLKVPMLYIKIN